MHSKKIRILSIGHSYVVSLNRAILREISKDPEFEVTVGAPAEFKGSLRTIKLEAEPPGSSLKLVSLPVYLSQKMHTFFYNPKQLRQLLKSSFDCAHFWEEPYILAGYQLAMAAKRAGTPFLFRTAQSLVKDYIFPFSYFEKASFTAAERFIAGGHLVYQAMRDKGWQIPGEVLTLAVDTEAFKAFDEVQKQEVRQRYGLQGPVIGYLGRLSEEKGCDLFMRVLEQLKDKQWSFLIMGSGPCEDKIRVWIDRNELQDRVKLVLLKHQEVPNVLPVCDVLICPSQTRKFWKEQFGRMLVEAFAAGVPVIASDSGEIPRVIADAGVVLPENNPQIWQQEISKFLANPTCLDPHKQRGFERAKHYSAKNIAEKYKQIYRELPNTAK